MDQPIELLLLDIPPMVKVMEGVVMELQDCALPLLKGTVRQPHLTYGHTLHVTTPYLRPHPACDHTLPTATPCM